MGDPFQPIIEAVEEIRREKVRGARWALYRASRAVIESFEEGASCKDAERISKSIENANKSMAPLYNLAYIIVEACKTNANPLLSVRALLEYYSRSLEQIREYGKMFERKVKIATISYSSSIEALLLAASKSIDEIIVMESRPGGEGALLAATLRDAGMKTLLIPDTAAPLYIETVDYILIGADAITWDACLVNKIGTRMLTIISKTSNKPVIAVFDALKIHPSTTCGSHPIEERTYLAPGYGPVRYPLFDITPSNYITYMITEKGIQEYNKENIRQLWREMMEEIIQK